MTKLPQIQAKIREVCPDLKHDCSGGHSCYYEGHPEYEPTGLAHVLRAIGETEGNTFLMFDVCIIEGQMLRMQYLPGGEEYLAYWNLTKPLADQEDSVIDFLHSILCVQES